MKVGLSFRPHHIYVTLTSKYLKLRTEFVSIDDESTLSPNFVQFGSLLPENDGRVRQEMGPDMNFPAKSTTNCNN